MVVPECFVTKGVMILVIIDDFLDSHNFYSHSIHTLPRSWDSNPMLELWVSLFFSCLLRNFLTYYIIQRIEVSFFLSWKFWGCFSIGFFSYIVFHLESITYWFMTGVWYFSLRECWNHKLFSVRFYYFVCIFVLYLLFWYFNFWVCFYYYNLLVLSYWS